MTLQIACVVKYSNNIHHIFAASAVYKKVARSADRSQGTPGPLAAEERVIGADTSRQIRPLLGSGTLRIGCNVAKRLLQEIPVARGCALTKSLLAPP